MSAPLLIAVLSLLFAAAAIGAVVSCFFRLKTTEAQSAAAQKSLREELQLYNSAAAGMGREIAGLKQQLLVMEEKLQALQDFDPRQTNYELAERLMEKGESLHEVESTCQISPAEARLMERIQKKEV